MHRRRCRVQLARGQLPDGSRLFSEATARELTTIVTPMPIGNPPPELMPLKANFRGYALGLDIRDYRGHKLVAHTGGLPGTMSLIVHTSKGLCWAANLNTRSKDSSASGELDRMMWQIVPAG